jgi:hypothetical protein
LGILRRRDPQPHSHIFRLPPETLPDEAMSKLPLPPGIHIILGDSAGGIFNRVFGATRLLADQDVLCCGPTPACATLDEWRGMRMAYWKSLVPARYLEAAIGEGGLNDYSTRLLEAERIHIWAATSVSEQLFIAFVVHRVDALGIDAGKLRLVQFEKLRGTSRILAMGELNEENMSAHPEPAPFTAERLEDYRDAWSALTSSDPMNMAKFADRRAGASRWLRQAMQLMLRRFPDKRSGLTHWDHVLLRMVDEKGPRAARVIGAAMTADWDDADLVGDYFLFGRLLHLADERHPQPLLQLSGARTQLRDTDVALTDFGRKVLEGRASSYPTNLIDEWAAGVKIDSRAGKLWVREGEGIIRG